MFEHHSQPVVPRAVFLRRLLTSGSIGLAAIFASLVAGMLGFRAEGLEWIDAFLNSAMLLGGMGPLDHDRGVAGKIFEGIYAIYCGLAVITVAGVMLAPVIHRFLHKLHQQSGSR